MDKPILVSAGIISKEDKILIAQRKKDTLLEPNKWEFPGGKVEFLESPEECLIREIKEELSIDIKINKLLMINSHVYKKEDKYYHIILIAYLADWVNGECLNLDCQSFKWINIKDLLNYDFAEADKKIIEELIKL